MLTPLARGLAAGLCISLGGAVYLSCSEKIVGSILFAVALLCICRRGYFLFTGKVGFLVEDHSAAAWKLLLFCLLGNIAGAVLGGVLLSYAAPACSQAAAALCARKLESQSTVQSVILAFFCGMLMVLAVSIYRDQHSPEGIFYCVPVFILSGFEHSIADIFYFAAAQRLDGRAAGFLLAVLLGNSLGGVCLPLLERAGKEHNHG